MLNKFNKNLVKKTKSIDKILNYSKILKKINSKIKSRVTKIYLIFF